MNFLRSFFGIVLLLVLLLGGGFLLWSELRVYLAARELATDIKELREIAIAKSERGSCGEQAVKDYQLRFVNETEYVMEVRCLGRNSIVSEIKSKMLKYGVLKVDGSGYAFEPGLNSQGELAEVLVQAGYRTIAVSLENGMVTLSRKEEVSDMVAYASAETSCQGWGGQCCTPPQLIGEGERQERVVEDCPRDCYQSCQQRPLVLFFNTSPIMQVNTRELQLASENELVTFSYKTRDLDGEIQDVVLEFGDGSRHRGGAEDQVNHSYECESASCTYVARLVVTDAAGLVQAESPKNMITIRVPGN